MNIGEEKDHIYSIMRDVTQERRKLTDIYFCLKERLDDLNKLEEKGLDDLSLKGYVDLHNLHQKQTITSNIQRETDHIINIVEKNFDTKREESIIPKNLVSEQRFKDKEAIGISPAPSKAKNKGRRNSVKYIEIETLIENVLKDAGVPLSVPTLFDKVLAKYEGPELTAKNFRNNIMFKILKNNPRVQRVTRGCYQYMHSN